MASVAAHGHFDVARTGAWVLGTWTLSVWARSVRSVRTRTVWARSVRSVRAALDGAASTGRKRRHRAAQAADFGTRDFGRNPDHRFDF